MTQFAGLNPAPCPSCNRVDALVFKELVPRRMRVPPQPFADGSMSPPKFDEAQVQFECSLDHFNVLVTVDPSWSPPPEWLN
jgi:hypothetical protein